MKTTPWILSGVVVTVLSTAVFAAKDAKRPRRPGAPHHDASAAEALKNFDKNQDHKIDADELPALQQAFAALKKLDKNSNGEIELAEVEHPQSSPADGRKGRMLEHFKQIDKNGNHKIDADEVEALQKMIAGGRIMSRIDHNGNGKIDPDEVERLNHHLEHGMPGKGRPSASSTSPSVRKAPEKKTEEVSPPEAKPKVEEKKDDKSSTPAPEAKPPGNFGN